MRTRIEWGFYSLALALALTPGPRIIGFLSGSAWGIGLAIGTHKPKIKPEVK